MQHSLQSVINSIPFGFLLTDKNDHVTQMNTVTPSILKISKEKLFETPIFDIFSQQFSGSEDIINELKKGKRKEFEFEYINTSQAYIHISIHILQDDTWNVWMSWTFQDVSQEKTIDKAKTEIISLTSHQLRTPLSAIKWYTEMLLNGDCGDLNEKQRSYVTNIYKWNQRLVELVKSFLNISRIEMGTFTVKPEKYDLKSLVDSIVDEELVNIWADKGLITSRIYSSNIHPLMIDENIFRIILGNLINNAFKYSFDATTISIGIDETNTFLDHNKRQIDIKGGFVVSISDQWAGIPKEQNHLVFTELFRGENIRALPVEWTGLWLYIVKLLIDEIQWYIWFESVEDIWSTFYIHIPDDWMKPKEGIRTLHF